MGSVLLSVSLDKHRSQTSPRSRFGSLRNRTTTTADGSMMFTREDSAAAKLSHVKHIINMQCELYFFRDHLGLK